MPDQIYFKITIEKISKGIKEQSEWKQLYNNDHPKILADKEQSQYGYLQVTKEYTDSEKLLEQRVDSIDFDRVLRAINRNL